MSVEKLSTGTREVDKALQGGLPKGYLTCLAGPASSGKTTLCLQIAYDMTQKIVDALKVIVVSGQHSQQQMKERVGLISKNPEFDYREPLQNLWLLSGRDASDKLSLAKEVEADVLIFDSWPLAKDNLAVFSHENKITVLTADPSIMDADLAHADVAVQIEVDAYQNNRRRLRLRKNRFGGTDGIGQLLATTRGMLSDDAGTLARHHF